VVFEKGWGGVFLREISPMFLIWLVLQGGYLVVFVRFCEVLWRLRPFAAGFLSWNLLSGEFLLLCAFRE
jgi:hypothetical protein